MRAEPTDPVPIGGNVLLVLVDDLGVDKLAAYGMHDQVPPTPTLDALASAGVLFRNAWAHPSCSPTRAALLTGRYTRRTGLGRWVPPWHQSFRLDPDEVLLPELLADAGYSDAAVGKWHLGGFVDRQFPAEDPVESGFSWHEGTLANPDNSVLDAGLEQKGYFHWEKATNGALAWDDRYLTTATTDDALVQLAALPEPWLLYVAYNAPHIPLHVPPDHLYGGGLDPFTASDADLFDAMVEALDTELGRLLDGMPRAQRARTTVIVMSDNGTPQHAVRLPLDPVRSKGTLYEGGVNVPLLVTGPAVGAPGTESDALVASVDVWSTLAELAGVDPETVIDPRTKAPVRVDGVSFLPHLLDPDLPSTRPRAYSSMHFPNGPPPHARTEDALRDTRHKVVLAEPEGDWSFFEYRGPFDEGPELLAQGPLSPARQEAFDRLSAELEARIAAQQFGP